MGAEIENAQQMIRLWAHECLRVFHDRLIDDKDRFDSPFHPLSFCLLIIAFLLCAQRVVLRCSRHHA